MMRCSCLLVCCKAASCHTCLPVTKRHNLCCNVLLQAAEYKQERYEEVSVPHLACCRALEVRCRSLLKTYNV